MRRDQISSSLGLLVCVLLGELTRLRWRCESEGRLRRDDGWHGRSRAVWLDFDGGSRGDGTLFPVRRAAAQASVESESRDT